MRRGSVLFAASRDRGADSAGVPPGCRDARPERAGGDARERAAMGAGGEARGRAATQGGGAATQGGERRRKGAPNLRGLQKRVRGANIIFSLRYQQAASASTAPWVRA